MIGRLKHLAVRAFNAVGLDIRRRRPPAPDRASFRGALSQLARLGFQPRTVIDVGVAFHTPELYEAFPAAAILLVEPLAEFEPFLRQICSAHNAQYVLAAAGAAPGFAHLHVHRDPTSSSLFREVEGPAVDGTPRQVPVVTLDEQCATRALSGPFLIKVDVQGAELQVLAGAARTLQHTEAVILETTLFGTMLGAPRLYDLQHFMKQHGFVLYDLFGLLYRPLDHALSQMDVLFVREHGMFRQAHAFATPEQRQKMEQHMVQEFAARQRKLS